MTLLIHRHHLSFPLSLLLVLTHLGCCFPAQSAEWRGCVHAPDSTRSQSFRCSFSGTQGPARIDRVPTTHEANNRLARHCQEPRPGATPEALTLHGLEKPHTIPWQRREAAREARSPKFLHLPRANIIHTSMCSPGICQASHAATRLLPGPLQESGTIAPLCGAWPCTCARAGGPGRASGWVG